MGFYSDHKDLTNTNGIWIDMSLRSFNQAMENCPLSSMANSKATNVPILLQKPETSYQNSKRASGQTLMMMMIMMMNIKMKTIMMIMKMGVGMLYLNLS